MTCQKLLIFLIISSLPGTLRSQANRWNIVNYNSEAGMQNSVKGLVIDHNGFLWIAGEAGLVRYDGRSFRTYDNTGFPAIRNNRLIQLGLLRDSSLFFEDAEANYYSFSLDGAPRLLFADSIQSNLPHALPYMRIYDIYQRCLKMMQQGLIPEDALPDYRLISSSAINSMALVGKRLFYLNRKRQLYSTDTALSSFSKCEFDAVMRAQMENLATRPAMSLMSWQDQLYMRWGAFIYHVDIKKGAKLSGERVLQVDSIPNITAYATLNASGKTFLGTMANGLYVFTQKSFTTLTLPDKEANIFYAQQPYEGDGVVMKKGALFPACFLPFDTSFTSETILRSKDGDYYLEKRLSLDSGVITRYNGRLQPISRIPWNHSLIRCIYQVKDGTIFLSGEEGLGEIRNNEAVLRPRPFGLPAGFSIAALLQTEPQTLLAGGEKGLVRIDLAANTARVFPELSHANIRCLYQDSKGAVLVGTYGEGYWAIYNERIIPLPLDPNHYLSTAHAFLEDGKGFLWIPTNRGLFQVSLRDIHDYVDGRVKDIYYYYFDHTAGFLTNEFNGGCVPAGIVLGNGKFSLPSMNGLVQFYPDSISPVLPVAGIYIDGIAADSARMNYDGGPVTIPAGTKRLVVEISSPFFGNDYNQSLEYRLLGLDESWQPVQHNNSIEFTGLSTGSYSLQLRKKAGFGKSNRITKTAVFFVKPAFYQTSLFKFLVICVIGTLIYLFYRWRVSYLLNQKKTLEKEVAQRTAEQNQLIEDMELVIADLEKSTEQLNQNLQFRETLIRIISHDIQSPLRFLADMAQKLHAKSGIEATEASRKMSGQLQKAAGHIFHFVEDLSLWLTKMQKGMQVNRQWVNAALLLQDLLNLFAEPAATKGNEIILESERLLIFTDPDMIKTVIRNIVDNANKHTANGSIFVTLNEGERGATITIRDTGAGIYPEILERVKLALQEEKEGSVGRLTGFGYMFVRDFCRLLEIEVEIESELGKGTAVYMKNIKFRKGNA